MINKRFINASLGSEYFGISRMGGRLAGKGLNNFCLAHQTGKEDFLILQTVIVYVLVKRILQLVSFSRQSVYLMLSLNVII